MSTLLAKYESHSKQGTFYEVIKGDDDVVYCTCWGWKKNRTCKHLQDYMNGHQPKPLTKTIEEVIAELTR